MAIMECNYFSSVLMNNVTFNVFIPTPEGNEQITDDATKKMYHYNDGRLPVVYLLHGAFGNYCSWMRFSSVERYAQAHRCALVMASAENSFYQDMYHGLRFETFFSKELPEFIKNVFPVSGRREDTYIAGFSMGGYGAWFLALSHPELYCKAASMSGALDIAALGSSSAGKDDAFSALWSNNFEDPFHLGGTKYDLFRLYKDCEAAGTLPELYQTCGRQDILYDMNISAKNRLEKMGAKFVYKEDEGMHDWNFWDKHIQDVFDWMLPKK
jgi:putative tributyrin esterase